MVDGGRLEEGFGEEISIRLNGSELWRKGSV